MIPRILLLVFFSYVSLNAQTKLSYTFNVSPEHTKENIVLIEDYFGPPKKINRAHVWEKQGAGYRYTLRLKGRKVSLRYTGKSIQVERIIRRLRKEIKR